MPPPARLLTMPQAARAMGYEGRYPSEYARRWLLSYEDRTGRAVLVRVGGQGKGVRYLIDPGNLALALRPEDEVRKAEVADMVQGYMRRFEAKVDARFEELEERDIALADQIRAIREWTRVDASGGRARQG